MGVKLLFLTENPDIIKCNGYRNLYKGHLKTKSYLRQDFITGQAGEEYYEKEKTQIDTKRVIEDLLLKKIIQRSKTFNETGYQR